MAEKEKLLTRYLIFETDAAAAVFTRVGEQLANGAEEALRKFYAEPPTDRDGFNVAVSENNFRLRKAKARVTTSLEEVDLPDLGEELKQIDEPEAEPVKQPETVPGRGALVS